MDVIGLQLLEQPALAHAQGRDLGPHVAQDLVRNPHVLLDHPHQGDIGLATLDDFGRRNAQPFLENLGAVGRVAARHPAPHVGVVQNDTEEGDPNTVL